jgi:hypothetical protein
MTFSVLASAYRGKRPTSYLTHALITESGKTPCGIPAEHLCQDGTETETPTCPECSRWIAE